MHAMALALALALRSKSRHVVSARAQRQCGHLALSCGADSLILLIEAISQDSQEARAGRLP